MLMLPDSPVKGSVSWVSERGSKTIGPMSCNSDALPMWESSCQISAASLHFVMLSTANTVRYGVLDTIKAKKPRLAVLENVRGVLIHLGKVVKTMKDTLGSEYNVIVAPWLSINN